MASITQAEADALVAEPKVISANIRWRQWGRGHRMDDVIVLGLRSGQVLKLAGWIGPKNRSYALLCRNQPIRKWTVHEQTKRPDGTALLGPHKHSWDDELEDEYAYVPEDIRIGNPFDELQDFLAECNIQLVGDSGFPTMFTQSTT